MKIITLVENTKNHSSNLINEHGLCLYIEKGNKRILFDTGRTGNFISNAKKLAVDIEDIDAVVISHGHGDHGGGLLHFLKANSKAKVYMKRKASEEHYFNFMLLSKNVSIDKKVFDEYSNRINYIDNFTEIMKDIYIITDIENHYMVPKGNKYLYCKEETGLVRDRFEHELIMIIKEQDGISIFTGCSHNGTANMIQTARNTFPSSSIKVIIGGFHLIRIPILKCLTSPQDEIDAISKKIIEEKVAKVYTGHCTGEKAYNKLRSILGDKIEYIKTGSEINI